MERTPRLTGSKGFTMIELMISVSILAIIITGMTIALQQQQRQFKMTKEAVDMDQTGRATLDYLATEIRNAGSRQGKTFAVQFVNGGSEGNNPCTVDTDKDGSANSPPDCITLYTWDITRGQDGTDLPSVPGLIEVVQNDPLQLRLPSQWFDEDTNNLIGEIAANPEILLGLRSRTALCNPDSTVNCNLEPEKCTECSVILRASVDGSTKTATIDSLEDIKVHNLPVSTFGGFSDFINGTAVNGVDYGFLPTFSSQTSEMTIVTSKTLMVDLADNELLLQRNGGQVLPIAGGVNAPGIVDFQLVFNLQDSNGGITKVGVPLAANNGKYPDFTATALNGREQDIRSVEIYIVVKSKIKPQKMQGGEYTQTIPAIADVLQRTVASPSATTNEPEEGYTYRILSTTVYMRNHSREEFG
ncbi:MAG: prepilin-type N-terminal cleavage/methylation domain-containing protein [Thermodesulfobacteriota bacterium]